MSASLLSIQKLNPPGGFPAYMVASTAPYNVEDPALEFLDPVTKKIPEKSEKLLKQIIAHLKEHKGNAEILIVIHGYNTSVTGVKEWFEDIKKHIENYRGCPDGFLLIGYRWPSEQIVASELSGSRKSTLDAVKDKYESSKKVLPVVLNVISHYGILGFVGGVTGLLVSLLVSLLTDVLAVPDMSTVRVVALIFIVASLVAILPIFTVLLLRLAGYFRDNYRANYYGVPDLVELIRQIDAGLIDGVSDEERGKLKEDWDKRRIKLSFLGHSMGGFVVTNTVRILSNVFDSKSVGTLSTTDTKKAPSPDIGNVFRLGRLVLVSPDIPAETIISGRANYLKSSLRRFEEAYLFSNEGDMALRLASTAANYFSFPTRTQDGGYRLGNVNIRSAQEGKLKDNQEDPEDYGLIVRLPNELLVKLQGTHIAARPDLSFGYRLGAQLAQIKDGQPVNFQGHPLHVRNLARDPVRRQDSDYVWPQEGYLESLQDGQIVRIQNGSLVSLQTTKYEGQPIWCFVEVQEDHLFRIQKDDFFSLNHGQLIKLEYGRIAQVRSGQVIALEEGQYVSGPAGTMFQVGKGQLFEIKKGLQMRVEIPLPLVQNGQLVKLSRGEIIRVKDGVALESSKITELKEQDKIAILGRFPLDYLYIRKTTALSTRQGSISLSPNETPIGELFTFFDCTDYIEPCQGKSMGVLSHAECKKVLNLWHYLRLTAAYFSGKIDTHGGYFSNGEWKSNDRWEEDKQIKPEASFSKLAIYGLACLGFKEFLHELKNQPVFTENERLQKIYKQMLEELREKHCYSESQREQLAMVQVFSSICQSKQIQGLLSQRRFSEDILEIKAG